MKANLSHILSIIVIAGVFTVGCASSGTSGAGRSFGNQVKENPKVTVQNPTISLADYLRRLPGVNVRGAGNNVQVIIRGVSTLRGDPSPLYYIDQVRVGRSYSRVADMINMHDVDHIEVVKGVSASYYGVEGANGVIIINTKR